MLTNTKYGQNLNSVSEINNVENIFVGSYSATAKLTFDLLDINFLSYNNFIMLEIVQNVIIMIRIPELEPKGALCGNTNLNLILIRKSKYNNLF